MDEIQFCPTCSSPYKGTRKILWEHGGVACRDPWHDISDPDILVLTDWDVRFLKAIKIDPGFELLAP